MPRLAARRMPPAIAAALLATAILASPTALPALADDGGVAWTVRTADNDLGTDRANFSYDVAPGDTISDTMVVVNTGTVALPLSVYAADAFTTTSGNIDILPAGAASQDAGLWVRPTVAEVALDPGATAEIAFTVSVPADAAPGDHSAGLVTSLVSQDSSQALSVDRRLGSRIHLRVAGEFEPAASVTVLESTVAPSLDPFAPGTLRLTYRVDNTGNTRLVADEAIATSGPLGLLAADQSGPPLAEILPGSSIEVTRELSVPALGWVGGELTVSAQGVGLGAGSVAPVTASFGVVAVPWTLVILVLVVAGATVGVVLWIKRARRRRGEAGPSVG